MPVWRVDDTPSVSFWRWCAVCIRGKMYLLGETPRDGGRISTEIQSIEKVNDDPLMYEVKTKSGRIYGCVAEPTYPGPDAVYVLNRVTAPNQLEAEMVEDIDRIFAYTRSEDTGTDSDQV